MVYCVPISVCLSVLTVPTSPSLQKWECTGWYIVSYLRMYILGYCPHVSKSPKMRVYSVIYCVPISVCISVRTVPDVPNSPKKRVYRGGVLCPYLRMYIRRYCPHVPKSPKWECIGVEYCVSISVYISLGTVPTSPSLRTWECIGVVYCVPISVCLSLRTVPTSPSLQKWECTGWYIVSYLRMYVLGYCPHASKSPKMRVYSVIYCVPISVCISVRTVPCPHVPKNESV